MFLSFYKTLDNTIEAGDIFMFWSSPVNLIVNAMTHHFGSKMYLKHPRHANLYDFCVIDFEFET